MLLGRYSLFRRRFVLLEGKRFFNKGMGSTLSRAPKQVYAITTYDAAFKWVLNSDSVRSSFLHAFIPNMPIKSSKRLDDHMNPVQSLQLLQV